MDKNISTALVTIAIPIYNAENYLHYAIQSCINQTYKNWILLLMCDGSTDNSTAIAYSMAEKDTRIKVVDDGENKGLVARLNQTIQMTETKYYARMDADDIMFISRIEEQVRFMEEHQDIDVCGSSIMIIDNNNSIKGSGLSEGPVLGFFHPTVFGKTEWFKKNLYAEWALRAEDFELWNRTISYSKFFSIGKPLLFYREYGIPIVKKYIQTQNTILRVFSYYRKYDKTFFWFLSNSLVSIGKICLYQLFSAFDGIESLVSMRKRKSVSSKQQLRQADLFLSIKFND